MCTAKVIPKCLTDNVASISRGLHDRWESLLFGKKKSTNTNVYAHVICRSHNDANDGVYVYIYTYVLYYTPPSHP